MIARAWSLRAIRPLAAVALLALAASLLSSGAARACGTQSCEPEVFLAEFSDQAIAVLADGNLPEAERTDAFSRLFVAGFDVDLISRFVLGRFWNTTSPEQRREYRDLFEAFVTTAYARRLGGYSGETLSLGTVRPLGENGAVVSSRILRTKGEPIKVDWRLRCKKDNWRIIDIVVEGVSLAVTQRSEFTAVIVNSGGHVDALLDKLRERIDAAGSGSG